MNIAAPVKTRSQQLAERAFDRVQRREELKGKYREEYVGFAKRFPSLTHTCGLAQAVAFAQAKAPEDYLDDLREVMNSDQASATGFASLTRSAELTEYMQLSRAALEAAGWLKRYAEALLEDC
jgi:CRISPR-associated protein Cmr5